MATFIATIKFTEEGIQNIHDSEKREAAFKAAAKKMRAKVVSVYWTLGEDDGLLIFEAPDDETAIALMLDLGSKGHVRTKTVRAFNRAEMSKILSQMNG